MPVPGPWKRSAKMFGSGFLNAKWYDYNRTIDRIDL